ncbi:hypothetical protein ACFVW1_12420 [Streptomyces olivochromogenes]|uniref:hypothetical protein n=1 Tax=Streptomyces olivochromogenes TaxID=1963 RepID=UPI0036DC7FA7
MELPLHMAWSGMTSYDLYRTVLHEGLHDDLPRYLNQDLLLQMWPVLRTLVGRTVRAVRKDAFPQLASRTGQPRDGQAGAAHAVMCEPASGVSGSGLAQVSW